MGTPPHQGVLLSPHFILSYLFRCQLLAGIAVSVLLKLAPRTQPGLIGARQAERRGLACAERGAGLVPGEPATTPKCVQQGLGPYKLLGHLPQCWGQTSHTLAKPERDYKTRNGCLCGSGGPLEVTEAHRLSQGDRSVSLLSSTVRNIS